MSFEKVFIDHMKDLISYVRKKKEIFTDYLLILKEHQLRSYDI